MDSPSSDSTSESTPSNIDQMVAIAQQIGAKYEAVCVERDKLQSRLKLTSDQLFQARNELTDRDVKMARDNKSLIDGLQDARNHDVQPDVRASQLTTENSVLKKENDRLKDMIRRLITEKSQAVVEANVYKKQIHEIRLDHHHARLKLERSAQKADKGKWEANQHALQVLRESIGPTIKVKRPSEEP